MEEKLLSKEKNTSADKVTIFVICLKEEGTLIKGGMIRREPNKDSYLVAPESQVVWMLSGNSGKPRRKAPVGADELHEQAGAATAS